jgi:hypothetical protein
MFSMIQSRLLLVAPMLALVSIIAVLVAFLLRRTTRVDAVGTSVSILAQCAINVRERLSEINEPVSNRGLRT